MRTLTWTLLLGCLLLLSTCTAEPQMVDSCVTGEPAGFWLGLWHGIIAPFTFILSLFADSISVFAVNNTGGWYVFGFLLGVGAFSSGAGRASKRR